MFRLSDIDECKGMGIRCGPGKTCFNQRGGFECVDVSCPVNYTKDAIKGLVFSFV